MKQIIKAFLLGEIIAILIVFLLIRIFKLGQLASFNVGMVCGCVGVLLAFKIID